jgi:hypothetical protein
LKQTTTRKQKFNQYAVKAVSQEYSLPEQGLLCRDALPKKANLTTDEHE